MKNRLAHKNALFLLESLLAFPSVYKLLQNGLGAAEVFRKHVRDFIQPFPNARILDIGCGPGSILEYLPHNVKYVGCDISQTYIEYAVIKYASRGEFYCKAVGDLPEFGKFDIVLATGVLHHLDDQEAGFLFEKAAHHLNPGGYLVTLDNAYVEGQARVARWLISMDRGNHVRTPQGYQGLARPYFSTLRCVTRHDMLRVPYTHFIMKCANP